MQGSYNFFMFKPLGSSWSLSSLSISLQQVSLGPRFPHQQHCSGSERNLTECPFVTSSNHYSCYQYNYAAVSCFGNESLKLMFLYNNYEIYSAEPCNNGEVELTGSSSPLAGVPLVCADNRWGKVCSEGNNELASVICSQLRYSPYG